MAAPVSITMFTDPACPFAFSAEPARLALRWHYGDGLSWRLTMIVLTLEPGEAEKLAGGAAGLQRRHGMPIAPGPYPRPASSEPACRAVVAARAHAPRSADGLLRALRVRVMHGGLIDDPALIAAAAGDAGLEPRRLSDWCAEPAVGEALAADIAAARAPSPAARALDHKLGGPAGRRRYSAPSLELAAPGGATRISLPGFQPFAAYEAAVANLEPQLPRRPAPSSVVELLEWADYPLATAEVVAIMGGEEPLIRSQLARHAVARPAGADAYWSVGQPIATRRPRSPKSPATS